VDYDDRFLEVGQDFPDAEPLRQALGTLEPFMLGMLEGVLVDNLYMLLKEGWAKPPRPARTALELIKIQAEAEVFLDDEGGADWS
jgi:hypothetical protein